MALAVAALTSGEDTDGGTSATTASISPSSNALVICDVVNIDSDFSASVTPTVSGNGLTWVEIANMTPVGGIIRFTRFRAMGASPSSGSVTISCSVNQTLISYSIYEITGVDTSGANGSGAVVQTVTNNATGTSLTVTLSAFGSAGNMAIGAFCYGGDASDFTVGSGFTQIHETPTGTLFTEYKLNDTTVDATNSTSQELSGIASEIKAATASGQPTSKRFGGVPFMGAHGAGIPSAVRQWMRRDSGLIAPQVATAIWRPAHGIN